MLSVEVKPDSASRLIKTQLLFLVTPFFLIEELSRTRDPSTHQPFQLVGPVLLSSEQLFTGSKPRWNQDPLNTTTVPVEKQKAQELNVSRV